MEGIFHPTMEEYTENSYRYNACPAIAFSDDGELNILAIQANPLLSEHDMFLFFKDINSDYENGESINIE